MPEVTTPEPVGKAKRVVGMFVAMVGSGIALESSAVWTGTVIMLAGVLTMAWGLVEAGPTGSGVPREPESEAAAAHHTTESTP